MKHLLFFHGKKLLRERVSVRFIVRTLPDLSQLSVVSGTNISVMQICGGRKNSIFSSIRPEGRTIEVSKMLKFYLRRCGKEVQDKKLTAAQNSSVRNKMYINVQSNTTFII
jgi:hypothetical protein